MIRDPEAVRSGWFFPRLLVLTALMEGFTLFCRFGLRLQATRDTASTLGQFTCGVRVHHSYIGLALIGVALLLSRRRGALFRWILVLGSAMILSDLVHHFLVLWPLTGDPEFHLLYPR